MAKHIIYKLFFLLFLFFWSPWRDEKYFVSFLVFWRRRVRLFISKTRETCVIPPFDNLPPSREQQHLREKSECVDRYMWLYKLRNHTTNRFLNFLYLPPPLLFCLHSRRETFINFFFLRFSRPSSYVSSDDDARQPLRGLSKFRHSVDQGWRL